jgi:adenylate cyclase
LAKEISLRVLVVDDNADNRQLMADIISSMGLEVVRAASGLETLASAQAQPPDLIILDVNMPGMTGFEVCERLKTDPKTAQIPILLVTALSDVENRVQGLQKGADDYLTKPYNPRELIERVRTRLRLKSETDELRKVPQLIRSTFERFVSPQVVDQLLQDPAGVQLGGRLQSVTVMFADLEGFTAMAERTEPHKLLAVLNSYHSMMVRMILERGGTVDKFIGDAVMALYNTPLEQADHAVRAVLTAVDIRDSLLRFHQQFEPEYRMRINFGLHTGLAVVGNVGAPEIMNYTAVGDAVNLAARLQTLSKQGQILISDAVHHQIDGKMATTPLGAVRLKGRTEEVMVYEVLA